MLNPYLAIVIDMNHSKVKASKSNYVNHPKCVVKVYKCRSDKRRQKENHLSRDQIPISSSPGPHKLISCRSTLNPHGQDSIPLCTSALQLCLCLGFVWGQLRFMFCVSPILALLTVITDLILKNWSQTSPPQTVKFLEMLIPVPGLLCHKSP